MEATLWPYGKCRKCANKNYCIWSKNEILNCMNNGYPNFCEMTNADRIRAMTDEELAEFIWDYNFMHHDKPQELLDWLRKEAE